MLRYFLTKMMNAPDNPLLKKASLSFKALKNTFFEVDVDDSKPDKADEIDV